MLPPACCFVCRVACKSKYAAMALQRAMGEFGAVSVISGNIIGRTQTLTLYVEGAYKVLMCSCSTRAM